MNFLKQQSDVLFPRCSVVFEGSLSRAQSFHARHSFGISLVSCGFCVLMRTTKKNYCPIVMVSPRTDLNLPFGENVVVILNLLSVV